MQKKLVIITHSWAASLIKSGARREILHLLTRWQTEKMSVHVIMSFGIVLYIKRRISVPQSKYFSKLRIIALWPRFVCILGKITHTRVFKKKAP